MKSKRAALVLAFGGLLTSSSLTGALAGDGFLGGAGFSTNAGSQTGSQIPTSWHSEATEEVIPVSYCDESGCDSGQGGPSLANLFPKLGGGCDAPFEEPCDTGPGWLASKKSCGMSEPFALFGEACGYAAGGWAQVGYHNHALPLFNSRPDEYQLHQMWLYAEKTLDTSCGFGFGGRVDYLYGTDAPDTQAFGIDNGHWDTDWDHGPDNSGYGHALPQAYGEAGYGDFSVKFGHFFTIIGWEVVPAPDNFFYSHAYTMYNSEPFTHTGVLATYEACDDVSVYGGYTMGWDSGFEDNGDSFLGGASVSLCENISVTYATVAGRFSKNAVNGALSERGYMHSIVSDVSLTDRLQYIGQSDLLSTEDANGNTLRETIGYNNYLIYTLNDKWAFGTRLEWWEIDGSTNPVNEDFDFYQLTLGMNYKPCPNVLIRPEIRWDWVDGNTAILNALNGPVLEDLDDDQATFGFDTIFLF